MTEPAIKLFTAFEGHRLIVRSSLPEVALTVKAASDAGSTERLLVFDDATGRSVDIDLRGNAEDVRERLSQPPQTFIGRFRSPVSQPVKADDTRDSEPRGRGRPKLGVVPREITLLPRHWEWLGAQPGGASAALRRLVDNARRTELPKAKQRIAQEAAYQFMTAIAGDFSGYEEAIRTLFTGDLSRLAQQMEAWPADIREYALSLAAA